MVNLKNKKPSSSLPIFVVTGLINIALSQTGCMPEQQSSSDSTSLATANTENENANNSQSAELLFRKIFVNEAELEQIKPHKVECPNDQSKGKPRICIQICHVPPGNPQEAKDKVIPLQALNAHLNHGPDHLEDRDYLGKCAAPIDPVQPTDPAQLADPTQPSDQAEPTIDPSQPSDLAVIPLWCQSYIEIDSNCDGYDDVTGDPLL